MFRSAISLALFCAVGLGFLPALSNSKAGGEEQPDPRGVQFFEKKIRPVLIKHCYKCHSAKSKEVKGDLLVDTRQGIRKGGESGSAVVPGKPDASPLMSAIRFEDFEMPPEKQLPTDVIADFEKWIKMGAPDPRGGNTPLARKKYGPQDLEKARRFWSFQPIQNPQPPMVKNKNWPRTDIDRFVLASLESKGLKPIIDARPEVLVRRLCFDLIGLPPTPEQVEEFVSDPTPESWKRLVNQLLDSPQFGERWGRHWLDVVRYGESTGMERNFTYPYAWRYRDYVINSFNEDKPFSQFITEQVAGDLLPADNAQQRREQVIATGLLAIGVKSLNERNREKFHMDVVDDQIDVTTQAFLAFTASCARCHDHKFDPISNEEYYSLAGIFRSTDTFYGTARGNGNRQQGGLLAVRQNSVSRIAAAGGGRKNAANRRKIAKQLRNSQRRLRQLQNQAAKNNSANKKLANTQKRVRQLRAQLKKLDAAAKPSSQATGKESGAALVMGVQDAANPSDTEVRIRGEANQRGDSVPRGFFRVVSYGKPPQIESSGSGRRQYAHWLTSKENPLTARVAVNRVWSHLFGRGIVETVNNFGANGTRPTHPRLLDHLATEFVNNHWSVKDLIRKIATSRVYQLGSGRDMAAHKLEYEVDPGNHLLWKMNQRRLEAEAIRDAILLVSGRLDLQPGKGSVVQSIGNGEVGRTIRPDRLAVAHVKRSVYLPIVRSAIPEVLRVFDFPDPSIINGSREVTTVPTQALFMMNSPFVLEQSKHFAKRILEAESEDARRVGLAYQLALLRAPSPAEVEAALSFVEQTAQSLGEGSANPDETLVEAWSGFCQTLFACSEFRYID